jgi:hypothetical protein
VCTNFALFTRTVVAETVSEILEFRHHAHVNNQILIPSSREFQNSTHLVHHKRSVYGSLNKPSIKSKPLGCIHVNTFRTNVSIGIQEAQEKV